MTNKWRPDLKCPYPKTVADDCIGEIPNEKYKIWWEAVDATIEALRISPECKPYREGASRSITHGENTLATRATRVSIPDDPPEVKEQPKSNKSTQWCPEHGYPLPCAKCGLESFVPGSVTFNEQPKEQLMICPTEKDCREMTCEQRRPHSKDDSCFILCPRNGLSCIPYKPQPDVEVGCIEPYEIGYRDYWKDYWQPHKASKVIEKGYFDTHKFFPIATWLESTPSCTFTNGT